MEKTPRDNLRILGAVQILVVILLFLLAAHLTSQTGQQGKETEYLARFLSFFFPFLLILGILGVAALSGRSWGFPLSVAIAVFLLGYAVIQTGLIRHHGSLNDMKTTLSVIWFLVIYHLGFTVMYRNFLRRTQI
jgi:hypothetical protein